MPRCPRCSQQNAENAAFCGGCGQPVVAPCASCGQVSPASCRFCQNCGAPLGAGHPAAVPPVITAPQQQQPPPMTYRPSRPPSNAPAIIAAILILLLIAGGVVWAALKAYNSHQTQIGYAQSSDDFNAAAALYEKGDYEAAAAAFRKVRATSKHGETVYKATQGELFSYRQLGHRAQAQGDWARATQWYEAAVAVAPTDAQANQELAAARRATAATSAGPSSPTVTVMGEESELSGRKSPLPPGLTAQDFQNANNAAAGEAARLASEAEQAYRQGNNRLAVQLWTKAVAKAPGSPAAIQAQQRLTELNARTNLFQY